MIDVHGLGLTGYDAERILRDDLHGIMVEISDLLSILLLITIGDDDRSIERLIRGLKALPSRGKPSVPWQCPVLQAICSLPASRR